MNKLRYIFHLEPRRKRGLLLSFGFLFLVLYMAFWILYFSKPGKTLAAWFDDSWHYRKALVVDHTKVSGSANFTDFPVLVSRTDTDLRDKAQSDGDDILFTDIGGVKLDHEIESYTSATGVLVAWVRIPTLLAADSTQIFMYYGNPAAVNQQNKAGVWKNYRAVWHLNEDVTDEASTATHFDSAASPHNLTQNNNVETTGQIANAQDFDGTGDYLTGLDWDDMDIASGSDFTLSAWINIDSAAADRAIIVKKNGFNLTDTGYSFYTDDITGHVRLEAVDNDGTPDGYRLDSTTGITGPGWHHVVAVWDDDNATNTEIYIDGVDDNATDTGTIGNIGEIANALVLKIAAQSDNGAPMSGNIDEARVYSGALSPDWIATEFNNQNSPSTFFSTVGSEEQGPGPISYWNFDEANGSTANDYSTGSNNDLTITNAAWKTEDMCVSGKCLGFDGNADYATKTYSSDTELLPGTTSFSVSAWFKHTSTAGADTLISRVDAVAGVGWKVYMNSSGFMCFGIDDTAGTFPADSACGSTSLADSQWHYITAVKSGTSTITLFIDGRQITQTAVTAILTLNGTNAPFTVGNDFDNGTNGWDGFIDEVKYYNFAKTTAQIQAEFASRGATKGTSAQFGDPEQQNYLSNGLVGYWKMDEMTWAAPNCSATVTTDSSGNSLGLRACPATTGPTGGVTGKFGNSVTFDGTEEYLESTNTNLLFSGEVTVAAWVNVTAAGSTARKYIVNTTNNNQGYALTQSDTTPTMKFSIGDGSSYVYANGATTLSTGTWYHAVGTADASGNVRVYLNGVLDGTNTATGPMQTPSSINFRVGTRSTNNYFNGKIDDVRVYKRVLTPAEIQTLYNWAPGPVGHWKMDENTGTSTTNDSSGNGLTGTLNNMTMSDWKAGKFGSALNFDGSTKWIDLGAANILDDLPSMTVTGWIYYSTATDGRIMSKVTAGPGWIIMAASNDRITLWVDYSGAQDLQVNAAIQPNTWQHFAVVWNGTATAADVDVYINGVETAHTYDQNGDGSRTSDASSDARIGRTASAWLNGYLDDLKIYNYTRTPKQVVEDMNAGHPAGGSPISSQTIYWKLDEQQGGTANNSGTDGALDGTATGTAWLLENNCKLNGCINIDTATDDVTKTDPAFFDSLTGMTASFWLNPQTLATTNAIISKSNTSQETFLIQTDATNSDEIRIYIADTLTDTTNYFTTTNLDLANGTWYHIVVVYDATAAAADRVKVYKNGRLATGSVTGTIPSDGLTASSANFQVGESHKATAGLLSYIDEVKIYNFPLTASEVLIDANAGSSAALGGVLGTHNNEGFAGNPPVGWWKMDENTGTTAIDSSGNGYNGTLTNDPVWISGKIGSGIDFDGVNDYVDVGDSFYSDSLTIEAWIKVDSTPGADGKDIIVKRNNPGVTGGTNEWRLNIESNMNVYFSAWDSANGNVFSTTPYTNSTLSLNTWYHVAITTEGNGGVAQMYLNGVDYQSTVVNAVAAIRDSTSRIQFGPRTGSNDTRYFDGKIDDIRIYNYARTPAQVAYDYNRGAPIAWYKLDECQGTTAYNAAPAASGLAPGMNGTITPGSLGNTAAGTCDSGNSVHMWYNGRTGKYNSSLDFDGSDDYVTIANDANLNFGDTDDLIISGWFNRDTFTTDDVIVAKRNGIDNTNLGYILYIDDLTDKLTFEVSDATDEYQLESTSTFTSTGWNHFTIVWDQDSAANSEIYINGRDDNATDTGTIGNIGTLSNAFALMLGSESDGANYFDGKLDNIQLYRYAVSESNLDIIRRLYTEGSAVKFGPLTGSP